MARLPEGEREVRHEQVFRMLQKHGWGLREAEISEILGCDRRTINNYLHDLEKENKVYREGRTWFAG